MFNLIVRADEAQPISWGRMLEGAPPEVVSQHRNANGFDLDALAKLPAVTVREFTEDDTSAVALLGYMDEPSDNPHISRPILRFPAVKLLGRVPFGPWGGTHTCWMLCDGDPFQMFAPFALGGGLSSAIDETNPKLVAVMMPFRDPPSIDPVYQAISNGARAVGMKCQRVDEGKTPTDITDDIRRLIARCRLVVADLTDLNPNVMYEIGYAEGLGKPVVRVRKDDASGLPFDISHVRVITYRRDGSGLKDLSSQVSETISATLSL